MSTKRIREALDWMRQQSIGNPKVRPMVEAALIEVEAIERAAKVLTMGERVGDLNVRASVELLERIAKERRT